MLSQLLSKSLVILSSICFFIIIFSFINRVYILCLYKKTVRIKEPKPNEFFSELPVVTIQLPIYNETTVVQRLINNICALDYPREKLEIQVLDDSTDATKDLIETLCNEKRKEGINISHICRGNREGYKAGALQYGLKSAMGEFIAIFDSDFLPPSDFLKRTIHFFADKKLGWVQTSWGHLNENYSLLTQCIALFCDSMFRVESSARSKLRHWGIFNGTAGIIRRKMIEDVGGWHWDTITEDSDLSYRALSLGWKYVTLTETTCPCELPPTLPVFLEQQLRWSKGNIQVVKKLFSNILFSRVSLINKYDFVSYLTNYLFFPAVTIFSILVMPNILLNAKDAIWGIDVSVAFSGLVMGLTSLFFCSAILYMFFRFAQHKKDKKNSYIFYRTLVFVFMSVGLAPFITIAIFEGFFRKDKVFVRTPKYDITDMNKLAIKKMLPSSKIKKIAHLGIAMGIYMLFSIFICLFKHTEAVFLYLPEMILFFIAYSYFGMLLAFPNQKWFKNILEIKFPNADKPFKSELSVS